MRKGESDKDNKKVKSVGGWGVVDDAWLSSVHCIESYAIASTCEPVTVEKLIPSHDMSLTAAVM